MFSPVKNMEVVVPALGEPSPYDESNTGRLLRFIPIKDKDILSLMWFLPYSGTQYKTQPLKYFTHLFGHEGENSLLSYLISEGLALELSSYPDHELWSFSTFSVDITLTKKGFVEYERVLEAVFKYAQVLHSKGPQLQIFDELKKVGELEFAFADKSDPADYCIKLTSKLQLIKDSVEYRTNLLRHQYVVEEFNPTQIQELSDLLADPKNVNIYFRSKQFTEAECPLED